MKIIKAGNIALGYTGICTNCQCEIECSIHETKQTIDRDTVKGCATRYVECPQCKKDFLWVVPINTKYSLQPYHCGV